jgi:hypothetical protein
MWYCMVLLLIIFHSVGPSRPVSGIAKQNLASFQGSCCVSLSVKDSLKFIVGSHITSSPVTSPICFTSTHSHDITHFNC